MFITEVTSYVYNGSDAACLYWDTNSEIGISGVHVYIKNSRMARRITESNDWFASR